MSRRALIPDRGDVPPAMVARRLGLDLAEFDAIRSQLQVRGFPPPDETTGRYCIEAVDRWRLRRHPKLFPDLTAAPVATHAAAVFSERMRAFDG